MKLRIIILPILFLLLGLDANSSAMQTNEAKLLNSLRQAHKTYVSLKKEAESAFPGKKPNPMDDRLSLFKKLALHIRTMEGAPRLFPNIQGESRIWKEWVRIGVDGTPSPMPVPEAANFFEGPGGMVLPYNGEFQHSVTDVELPKRGGVGFEMKRFYSSHLDYDGPFGQGWDFSYNSRITTSAQQLEISNSFILYWSGRIIEFTRKGDVWLPQDGEFLGAVKENNNLVIITPELMRITFEPSAEQTDKHGRWRLASVASRHGSGKSNCISFSYFEGSDRIEFVTDPYNRKMHFVYNAEGRIIQIHSGNVVVTYSYSQKGLLEQVLYAKTTISLGKTARPGTDYSYNLHNGRNVLTREKGLSSPFFLGINYDSLNRVSTIGYYGRGSKQKWLFNYGSHTCTIQPPSPQPVSIYRYDSEITHPSLPVKRIVASRGAEWSYLYNSDYLPVEIRFPLGNKTKYFYDSDNPNPIMRGNCTKIISLPMEKNNTPWIEMGIETTYHLNIALPTKKSIYQINANGEKEWVKSELYKYSKDDLMLEKYDDSGIVSRYFYNRYGEAALILDGNNRATIYHYSDSPPGDTNYEFESGKPTGGGFPVRIIDDATLPQLNETCKILGVKRPNINEVTRFTPVALETRKAWNTEGKVVREKCGYTQSLWLYNRNGQEIALFDTKKGIKSISYVPWFKPERILHEFSPGEHNQFKGQYSGMLRGYLFAESFAYNALGFLSEHRLSNEPFGLQASFSTYQYRRYADGRIKSIIDPVGVERIDRYDKNTGFLINQTLRGDDKEVTISSNYSYFPDGQVKSYIDQFGGKWKYELDGFGSISTVIAPNDVVREERIDAIGRVLETSQSHGGRLLSKVRYNYNSLCLLDSTTTWRIGKGVDEVIESALYRYDPVGQILAERNEHIEGWSYYLYDGMNRRVAAATPGGDIHLTVHNKDAEGMTMKIFFNSLNKTTKEIGQLYLVDGVGRPYVSIPVNSRRKLVAERAQFFRFNSIGQLLSKHSVGLTKRNFAYDSLGNVIFENTIPLSTDQGEGAMAVSYEYRPNKQMTRKVVYNQALALTGSSNDLKPVLVNAPQKFLFTYDSLGRNISAMQPDGLIVKKHYNEHSLPNEMTWVHSTAPKKTLRSLKLDFSELGQILRISDTISEKKLREFTYNPLGDCIKTVDYGLEGDKIVLESTFDSTGLKLSESTSINHLQLPWQHVSYSLDKGLRKLTWRDLPVKSSMNWVSETHKRDGVNRLIDMRLDDSNKLFCSWTYLGGMPTSRTIPESRLSEFYSYSELMEPSLLHMKDIYSESDYGILMYEYGLQGQAEFSSTKLNTSNDGMYTYAQYQKFDSFRRLTAQNGETNIPNKSQIRNRYNQVFDSNHSLQALKTGRRVYDQANNTWVTYMGNKANSFKPGDFTALQRPEFCSPASVFEELAGNIPDSIAFELASNRETTKSSYDAYDNLVSEKYTYDKLGNLIQFKGSFWNGQLRYPVTWDLKYDALGRLIKMSGKALQDVEFVSEGQIAAELFFRYDSLNRRVSKKTVDHSIGNFVSTDETYTVYSGNNQALELLKKDDGLHILEQYLWGGSSRELLMGALPARYAEGISLPERYRYYFHQDRGLNTVCVTRVHNGKPNTVTAMSYLGFGENATTARIKSIRSSMAGANVYLARDQSLDNNKNASWINPGKLQFIELQLDQASALSFLNIWTEDAFPQTFSVFVIPRDFRSPHQAIVESWVSNAVKKGFLTQLVENSKYQDKLKRPDWESPYRLPLGDREGDRIVILWNEYSGRNIEVKEFGVIKVPDNPGAIAFAGQWLDRETDMYYQINRYRLASSNKFISPDPVGFMDGNNLYAYAHNNPLEWHDPDGRLPHILIGAGVGAVLGGGSYLVQCWWNEEEFDIAKFGIYAGAGALSGAAAAGTFGASLAWTAGAGITATKSALIAGGLSGIAGGAVHGAVSGGGITLYETGDVSLAIRNATKSMLISAAYGGMGGAVGGAVFAKLGATFWGATLSGTAGGGAVGGIAGGIKEAIETRTFAGAASGALIGVAKGAIVGAAIGTGGWAVGRASGMIKKLPKQPDFVEKRGLLVRTVRPETTKYGNRDVKPGYARHHKHPISLGGSDSPDNIAYVPLGKHRMNHPIGTQNDSIGTIYY